MPNILGVGVGVGVAALAGEVSGSLGRLWGLCWVLLFDSEGVSGRGNAVGPGGFGADGVAVNFFAKEGVMSKVVVRMADSFAEVPVVAET